MPITRISITVDEYHDHENANDGICLACHEWTTGGCEPDARGYECESCGKKQVYGLEEAMIMGLIDISG